MVFLRNEEGGAGRGLRLPVAAPTPCTPSLARCRVCVSFRPLAQARSSRPGRGDIPPLPRERRPQRPQLAVSTAECPRHQASLLPLPLPREWVARVTFERSLTLNEASAGLCFTVLPGDRACSVTWLSSCLCRPPPRGMACSPWTPCLPLVGFSRRKDQLRCNSIHTHTHALGEFCIEKKLQIRTMATAL